jgi:hypothetical protein
MIKTKQKNNVEVVVAAFNEDLSWIKEIKHPIYLYYKSNNHKKTISNEIVQCLPNIGRESHTYIHHIVANYNRLADITVFCQGNPFDHCPNFIELANLNSVYKMNQISKKQNIEIDPQFCPLTKLVWFIHINEIIDNKWDYVHRLPQAILAMEYLMPESEPIQNFLGLWGAMFAVTKEKIQSYPKKVYKKLLDMHQEYWSMPYGMEYIWMHIFNEKYKPKKIINYKI